MSDGYVEETLPLNYPIYYNHIYVAVFADGEEKPMRNTNLTQGTIGNLVVEWNDPYYKLKEKVVEIKKCDLVGRGLMGGAI